MGLAVRGLNEGGVVWGWVCGVVWLGCGWGLGFGVGTGEFSQNSALNSFHVLSVVWGGLLWGVVGVIDGGAAVAGVCWCLLVWLLLFLLYCLYGFD